MGETMTVDRDELRRLAQDAANHILELHILELAHTHWEADADFRFAANPATILALIASLEKAEAENARLREALDAIKSLGRVDMRGCWEHELRDIIGSMTDGAERALTANPVQGD